MGENFLKFKERAFKIRLFKAILAALALGCFTAGALLLFYKLELIGLKPFPCAAIGFAAGLALGFGLYFAIAFSDVELAYRHASEA